MMKNTKTSVKYNHILAQDYLIEENYYGEPVYAKAGSLLKTTKHACHYERYFWGYISQGIERSVPGTHVKVVKVTTTTTTEEEELVLQ